jgi:catechol 2,3-dioxygenase-like lactoylglutathione lyase family enzyme
VNFRISSIDHVQIAAPAGCEQIARDFYGSLLGMVEIAKPTVLRARGGCWFQCGAQQLHVGVENSFQPATKADPAFAVAGLARLREALQSRGLSTIEDDAIPGTQRFYVDDPWGNRLEFVEETITGR